MTITDQITSTIDATAHGRAMDTLIAECGDRYRQLIFIEAEAGHPLPAVRAAARLRIEYRGFYRTLHADALEALRRWPA